jgi:RHS repeat-associated protein
VNTWTEASLNWNNAPAMGSTITSVGSTTTNSYSNANVTGAVTTRGLISFGVTDPSTTVPITFSSKEASANKPQLVVTILAADSTAPTVPTAVVASAKSSSEIDLTWGASTDTVGVQGYKVYRNGTLVTTTGSIGSTSWFDTGLAPNTAYSYQITAIDAAGNETAKTTAVSVTTTDGAWTDSTAPTAPSGATATAGTGGIAVSWTAASDGSGSGIARYLVYRNATPLISVAGNATTFTDHSVVAGTQYSYAVAAVDAAGNVSLPSNTATATAPAATPPADTTAPSIPAGLTASGGIGKVTLGWSASSDNVAVAGYSVYRDGTLLGVTASVSYVDTTPALGISHSYTVAAFDGSANASAQSAPATATATGVAVASTTYAYDIADQLTSITAPSGTVTSFTLDVLGRHASRTVGTAPTDTYAYLGTSDTVISITTGTTVTLSAIDGQGERVATSTAGVSNWVLNDLHGNVAAALTADGSTIAAAYRYDAYGQTVASYSASGASVAWRYQGRLLESAPGTSDLYDFSARSYSPALGTFTQADTYNGSASNPGLLNHYMYTGGNPVTMSDPTGHSWCSICDTVGNWVGGLVGGAVSAGKQFVNWSLQQVTGAVSWTAGTVSSFAQGAAKTFIDFGQSAAGYINQAWTASGTALGNFARSADAWAADVRTSINGTIQSLGAMGQNLNLDTLGQLAIAMASDPHMLLAMASMVPGLGELAAAADVGLYLYEGDYQNAALAASAFIPGGAMLLVGGAAAVGVRAARVAEKGMSLMARAGARGLSVLARVGEKLAIGLRAAGKAVKAVITYATFQDPDLGRSCGHQAQGRWRPPRSAGKHVSGSLSARHRSLRRDRRHRCGRWLAVDARPGKFPQTATQSIRKPLTIRGNRS